MDNDVVIDIYCHVYPERYFAEMVRVAPRLEGLGKRLRSVHTLFDLDERFREMDGLGNYRQVISLPNPPLDDIMPPAIARDLAGIANDSLAELCARHPDRFPAFVATLSLGDVDGALVEVDRAVEELGAKGVQVFTSIDGRPLDDPAFLCVFEAATAYDLPVWLHPARTAVPPDYAREPSSRFEMWWCFGWPYDTSVAMARMVFSGLFDRFPDLKVITHHCGGMIPFFEGRVGAGLDVIGSRTTDEDHSNLLASLKRPHLDYFRDFYADTALLGASSGLRCGLDFFGVDKIVFASDAPFANIGATINAVKALELSPEAREQIFRGNAERLLRMRF